LFGGILVGIAIVVCLSSPLLVGGLVGEILVQPSEQRRAVRSHREYASVSPYMSEKMAMVRACIEY